MKFWISRWVDQDSLTGNYQLQLFNKELEVTKPKTDVSLQQETFKLKS